MSTFTFNPKEWDCAALQISRNKLKNSHGIIKTLAELNGIVTNPDNADIYTEVTNEISRKLSTVPPLIDAENAKKLTVIVEEFKKDENFKITGYKNPEQSIDFTLDYQEAAVGTLAKKVLHLYKEKIPKTTVESKKKGGGDKEKFENPEGKGKNTTPHHQNSRALTVSCNSIDETPQIKAYGRAEKPQDKTYYTTQKIYKILNKSGVCKYIKSVLVGIRTGRYNVGSLSGQLAYTLYKNDNKQDGVAKEWKEVLGLVHPESVLTTSTTPQSCAQITHSIRAKDVTKITDQNGVMAKLLTHEKADAFFGSLFQNNNRNDPLTKMAEFFTTNALHQEVKDHLNDEVTYQQQTDKYCDATQQITDYYNNPNGPQVTSYPAFIKTAATALQKFGNDEQAKTMVRRVIPFLVPYVERFTWCALNKVMANIVENPDHAGLGEGAPVAMLCQTNKSRDEQYITAFVDQKLNKRNTKYRLSGAAKKLLKEEEKATKAYNWWKGKCLGKRHVREQMKDTLEGLYKAWEKRQDKTLLENLETALESGDFNTIKSVVAKGSCLYSHFHKPAPSGAD